MSTTYYIEDVAGEYVSEDGSRRFKKIVGKDGYDYLKRKRGCDKTFFTTIDDNMNKICVEIPTNEQKEHLKEKRHSQYMQDSKKETNFEILSLDVPVGENENELLEAICDNSENITDIILLKTNIEKLQIAIKSLDLNEFHLIYNLFLSEKPLSETKLQELIGMPQQTISDMKKRVFEKIKKFL